MAPPMAPQLPSPLTPTSTTLAAPTPITPSPVTPSPVTPTPVTPTPTVLTPDTPTPNSCCHHCSEWQVVCPGQWVRLNKVKSTPTADDDDDEDPLANSVIVVKNKTTPAAPKATNSDALELSTPEDDALGSTEHLFGIQCKQCIKDDALCIVILGKKLEQEAAALLTEVTLKHANKKTWMVHNTTHNTTRNTTHAPQPSHAGDALTDADADGEDDTAEEPLAVAPAADLVDVTLLEITPSTSNHVDNDVNVDFTMEQLAPMSPAPVIREVTLELPAPQPSNLDIIQSIDAMCQDFTGLLQVSHDHVEVIRREVNTRIDKVEDCLTARITAMEKKMCEINLETASNTVNMGHMANAMQIMTQPAGISAAGPVTGSSTQGHPFGKIPQLWLAPPPALDYDILILDPSLSAVGKQFTTAWDISQGPAASRVVEHVDAIVETGSNLSSVPSDNGPSRH
ncbi:hypothetical protein EDD22DRAFT_852537 [Suillus occidentalis]|nr:hypothetical protein EDD22DRAFT_852537 [Suillus occidentalis]